MIFRLFKKNSPSQPLMIQQYGTLTSLAREQDFFLNYNVPDTVLGRFEILSVVLILYFRRTGRADEATKAIAQELVEAFFEDLDHAFRELGIGDSGVPKRMKKFAQMFYGRAESYGQALDAGDTDALATALKRNIHPESNDAELTMQPLALYMFKAEAALAAQPDNELAKGEARLPLPRFEDA